MWLRRGRSPVQPKPIAADPLSRARWSPFTWVGPRPWMFGGAPPLPRGPSHARCQALVRAPRAAGRALLGRGQTSARGGVCPRRRLAASVLLLCLRWQKVGGLKVGGSNIELTFSMDALVGPSPDPAYRDLGQGFPYVIGLAAREGAPPKRSDSTTKGNVIRHPT